MPKLDLSTLNDQQREATRYIDSALLVLAGAGSGKTRVITHKIGYLISECGIPARKITAVTFTNKAAREMKTRIAQLMGKKETRGITVCTFHSLGLKVIQREYKKLGLKSNFSLFDDYDTRTLLRELMLKDEGADVESDAIRNQISLWKNDLVTPEQAVSSASTPPHMISAKLYEAYDRHLKAYNAIDFDDLILLPSLLLQRDAEALERWQNRIHYMLVDEYQDTNGSQYQLIKLLMQNRGKLTVVGDDDQSIYAWRGAQPENLSLLEQDFPQLNIIKLEQNYRSTGHILNSANTLIANNPHMFEKKLWSQLGPGDPIKICAKKNEDKEAEWVAHEIMTQKIRHGRSFGDYAVLYRSNYQSRLLEIKLQALQIPYKVSGGTSFFSRTEIKDVMAYLRLLINPDDDNAYLRIINIPRREIGPSTLEKLGEYAQTRQKGMLDASQELGLSQSLSEKPLKRLQRFSEWTASIAREMHGAQTVAPIRRMIDEIGYHDWIHEQSSSDKVAEKRIENVEYLLASIEKMLKESDDVGSADNPLEKAITQLVIRDIIEQQADDKRNDEVQLMTLHASKGLEFPHVFMIGVEEEIIPHRTSLDEGNLEEERRLMYVGITRAQRTLHISYTSTRKQYGENVDCSPSRFLEELPEGAVQWEGDASAKKPREEQEAIAKAHLADLRKLLGNVDEI